MSLTHCTPLNVKHAALATEGGLPLLTRTVLFARVLVAPVCPAESSPSPADCQPQPLQAAVVLQTSDGSVDIAVLNSNGEGYLGLGLVGLPAGAYRLHPLSPRPGLPPFPPADLMVMVETEGVTFVEIMYDSGIR